MNLDFLNKENGELCFGVRFYKTVLIPVLYLNEKMSKQKYRDIYDPIFSRLIEKNKAIS